MNLKKQKKSIYREIIAELKMALIYIRWNISSLAELRFSFLMQIVGMMINNISFLMVWLFFFNAFGEINGWTQKEAFALEGFLATAYGIAFSFCTGVLKLPASINNGSFDSVLLTPRNLYLRILTLSTQASAMGDALFGIIVLGIYLFLAQLSLVQILLMLILIPPAALIILNFALITSCIGFLFPDAEDLSKNAFEIMFGPSMYPSGVYQGALRFFFLFILPSIAIGGLPVEAVRELDFSKVLIIFMLSTIWTLIALFVLKQGIKRYESGNLTGARI